MFLVADSPRYGVSVRLVGNVVADPQTGRLTASFTDNPQVPVSLVRVALRGGDRAPLVNPPACGKATITGQLHLVGRPDRDRDQRRHHRPGLRARGLLRAGPRGVGL